MNANTYLTEYKKSGVLLLGQTFSQQQINKWNTLLDPILDERRVSGNRCYVLADELYELGILQEVLSEDIKNLILTLEPNPVFFHCHVYDITAKTNKNHIGFHDSDGWHRDYFTESMVSENDTEAFSIFIYLTPVTTVDNGAFEIIPAYFNNDIKNGLKTHIFTGEEGTCFFWNRGLYHRPNPNLAELPRRVLKISIQSNGWENTRIDLEQFKNLEKMTTSSDSFVNYAAGGRFSNENKYEKFEYSAIDKLPELFYMENFSAVNISFKPKVLINRILAKLKRLIGF